MPVATGWHARYALGEASIETYFEGVRHPAVH
jgi:hypothetical protein